MTQGAAMDPLVSIVIPAYNKAEETLAAAESALGQTYGRVEVIVVDDGSTDATADFLSGRRDLRYVRQENAGACRARNTGLGLARGEVVGFLDCDDLYEPRKVEEGIRFLREHPECGFVHTAAWFIDARGSIVGRYAHPRSRGKTDVFRRLLMGNHICNSTVLVRRTCLDRIGGFDERIFMPADWDLWLRLAQRFPCGYQDLPLTRYRVSGNYILAHTERCFDEERYVLAKWVRLVDARTYRRALAALDRRAAQIAFLRGRRDRMRDLCREALRRDPASWKTWGLLTGSVLAPGRLRTALTRRIVRLPEEAPSTDFETAATCP